MTDEMPELTRAWHPRARVARVRASHSYGLVLALIVVSFVFMSVAPNSTWADSVLLLLQTITLVTALWTSGVARTDSTLSLGLVALAGLTALGLLVFAVSSEFRFVAPIFMVGMLFGPFLLLVPARADSTL